jgi:hypothetical protein
VTVGCRTHIAASESAGCRPWWGRG